MSEITDALDDGSEIRELMREFYPDALTVAYEDASNALKVELAFDVENERVQEVLDLLAKRVQRVAESTRDEIRALVSKQAAEGWTVKQLASEIRMLGEVNSPRRALVIAATETADAYSRGSVLAYRDSGVVSKKEWLTAPDEMVCPICAPLNGRRADLDAAFDDGLDNPPAHPLCRCALIPVVEG